jgi:hypothetical protein
VKKLSVRRQTVNDFVSDQDSSVVANRQLTGTFHNVIEVV